MKSSSVPPVTLPGHLPIETTDGSGLLPAGQVASVSNCPDTQTQPLFYMHCSKGFSGFQALSQHTEIVQSAKAYLCSQPGSPSQYPLLQDLSRRIKAAHTEEQKRYNQGPHLAQGLSGFQALSQHTEIVHSAKAYLCSQPGSPNQYRLLQDLKMRIKAVHQGGQNRGVPGLVPAQSRNENLSVKRQEPKPVTTSTVTRPTDTDSWIPTPAFWHETGTRLACSKPYSRRGAPRPQAAEATGRPGVSLVSGQQQASSILTPQTAGQGWTYPAQTHDYRAAAEIPYAQVPHEHSAVQQDMNPPLPELHRNCIERMLGEEWCENEPDCSGMDDH